MFSNEILEISLLNPEESKNTERKRNAEDMTCNALNLFTENDIKKDDEIEPRIGIIKLGEDSRAKQNLIKNLMCEHCGKKFNKSNQLFVHTRTHTSKLQKLIY